LSFLALGHLLGRDVSERKGFLWSILSRLPLLGRLREVPDDALREARDEVLTTTLFAAMPFWFPLVAYLVMTQPPAALEGLRKGELLIYSASLVGPLTYIITKRYGRFVAPNDDPDQPDTPLSFPFPYGRASVALAMIICVISGVVITLQKLDYLPKTKDLHLIYEPGLAITSLVVFVLATTLIFCVAAYRNLIEGLAQKHSDKINRAQTEDENKLSRQWQARLGDAE
jgi:hypothetical protein